MLICDSTILLLHLQEMYKILFENMKNSKRVCSGNTTIKNCRQTRDTARKSHTPITRHQEDKLGIATNQDGCKNRMDTNEDWKFSQVSYFVHFLWLEICKLYYLTDPRCQSPSAFVYGIKHF